MRTSAQNLALLLSLAVVATLACSKTQDSAPERRIFGEPPTILSVDPNFIAPEAQAACEFSDVISGFFCYFGFADMQLEAGTGWTLIPDPNDPKKTIVLHSDTPTAEPGIFINGNYTELNFKVQAVDPNSTPGNNNILLVSSSFVVPEGNNETTLVLFDDGSENLFPIEQRSSLPEDCAANPCACESARYNVKSGDIDKDNDLYSRKFVILNRTAPPFLTDCVMKSKANVGISAPPHSTFEFKIEAVDRQGNLAVWPNKVTAVSGDGRFACEGDSCGCCFLHYHNGLTELCDCVGEPGMRSPTPFPLGFPDGFCVEYLTTPQPGSGPDKIDPSDDVPICP